MTAAEHDTARPRFSPARIKGLLLLAALVLAGVQLLAWSQTWFEVAVSEGSSAERTLEVSGQIADPALASFALCGIALVAALAIAGPAFRVIMAVLQLALGVCVVLGAVTALADPVGSAARAVTEATGVAGDASVHEAASLASSTVYPVIALIAGGLQIVLGVAVLVTSRLWPATGSRYKTTRRKVAWQEVEESTENAGQTTAKRAPAKGEESVKDQRIGAWDSLSQGEDPTEMQ